MYGTVSVSSYALDAVSNSIFLILSRLDLSYLSLSLSLHMWIHFLTFSLQVSRRRMIDRAVMSTLLCAVVPV